MPAVGHASTSREVAACLERLAAAQRHRLRELPSLPAVPSGTGVYALWHHDELLYVGMVRTDPKDTTNPQARGVAGRLNTYRRCPLTERFTVALTFRFVVPTLSDAEREKLASGEMGVSAVQARTKKWLDDHVTFSTDAVAAPVARAAEERARSAGLGTSPRPWFNPKG
jgi:hypothetical protein